MTHGHGQPQDVVFHALFRDIVDNVHSTAIPAIGPIRLQQIDSRRL
jgi:hypothetical protein